jgi:RHS repeat-associated protein
MTGSATDTFFYDKVSRIKEARQTVGGLLKTQAYAYDTFGNLTTIGTQTLVVDPLTNRISCQECYDAAGSMTSWGDYSYAYYPTNQMMQMVGDGRTTLHGYSADGERVGTWDSVAGGITYVLRGLDNKPLRQYREFNGGWTWQKDWVYRDGLALATVEPTGTKYFHLDHLGTPRRITNSSRAVIASHDYYPFGEEITASSQDAEALKFTGHERDLRDPTKTTDDLDYMHARFYNPWIARFLSTDPIGGSPGAPQSWNRYSYVTNSPLAFNDPDGVRQNPVTGQRGVAGPAYGVIGAIRFSPANPQIGEFGWTRRDKHGNPKPHHGIDINSPTGTPLYAPEAGEITSLSSGPEGGNRMDIRTAAGETVVLTHLDSFASGLSVGDTVAEGAVVGESGTTGNQADPGDADYDPNQEHVHMAVIDSDGTRINPGTWLNDPTAPPPAGANP